jgi:hypothetical protein
MHFEGMTRYQARHHPAAAMIGILIFGPFLLAAALVYIVAYTAIAVLAHLNRLGRR